MSDEKLTALVPEYLASLRRDRAVRPAALSGLTEARLAALGAQRDEDFAAGCRVRVGRAHAAVKAGGGSEAVEWLERELRNAIDQLETQSEEMELALDESPAEAAAESAWHADFWAREHGTARLCKPFRRIVTRSDMSTPRLRRMARARAPRGSRRTRSNRARAPGREPSDPEPPARHARRRGNR